MGLARDLVQLSKTLQDRKADLFSSAGRSDLLSISECASLIDRVRCKDSADVIRLCLQALSIQHDELRPRLLDAELVATLPPETPGIARPTERVLAEMIGRTKSEIILLGYELTDLTLVALLAKVAAQGADVIMICDRGRGVARRILDRWPRDVVRPRIYHDRERGDGAPYASMHAKCVLVDGNDLLVTSANFTFHGLRGNIELGVRLCGSPATEARKIFSYLVESRVVEDATCAPSIE